MKASKCFILALESIWGNKVRALLTMLGIIIGISAVIVLVSLMNGFKAQITGIFEEMGTDMISVSVMSRGTTKVVDPEDLYELLDEYPDYLKYLSPSVTVNGTIKVDEHTDTITTSATGVSEQFKDIRKLVVEYGDFFSYIDVDKTLNSCVIGTYIAEEMFGRRDVVGETIKINGYRFNIVGVLEEMDDSSSSSSDNVIYIPYTRALKMNNTSIVNSYSFTVVDEDLSPEAKGIIKNKLYDILGDEDYYAVISMSELLEQMDTIMGSLSTILVTIAGISLLVGGIGIMNIMLVSVSERTCEIGIRKSLGARRKDIMRQFIIEAGVIGCIGGIIGILFGIFASNVGGNLMNLEPVISASSVMTSFSISVGIGILFGFLPANKASKLNPIDALRSD